MNSTISNNDAEYIENLIEALNNSMCNDNILSEANKNLIIDSQAHFQNNCANSLILTRINNLMGLMRDKMTNAPQTEA